MRWVKAIPIELVHHWPPEVAEHGDAFLAQAAAVVDGLIKPDLAVDALTVAAGFGKHHGDAVALVIDARDSVESKRCFAAALINALAGLVELPLAVGVVVDAENVGCLGVGLEPVDVDFGEAVTGDPGE